MKTAIRKQMRQARERDYIAWSEMDEEPWPMPQYEEREESGEEETEEEEE